MSLYDTKREVEPGSDDRWLRSAFGFDTGFPVTITVADFDTTGAAQAAEVDAYGNIRIPSGVPLGADKDTGEIVPYVNDTDTPFVGILKTEVRVLAGSGTTAVVAMLPVAIVRPRFMPYDTGDNLTTNLPAPSARAILIVEGN